MKIVSIGNNVIDYYVNQKKMYPGGNAINVAMLCKRYGAEISSYIGILGTDKEGNHIEAALKSEDVDTSRIRKVVGESGKVKIKLDETGDRMFLDWSKGVQSLVTIQLTPEDESYILSHTLLHTSVYSYLDNAIPALSRDISISFDFSTDKEKKYLQTICPYLEIAFFSASELSLEACRDLIEYAHKLGTQYVVVTRGEHGSVFSNGETIYNQTIAKANVVDTLGAGDTFISMFLTVFNQSRDFEDAMQKASAAASETCGHYGTFGYGINVD